MRNTPSTWSPRAAAQVLHEDRRRLDEAEPPGAAPGLETHRVARGDADTTTIRLDDSDTAVGVQTVDQPHPRIEMQS